MTARGKLGSGDAWGRVNDRASPSGRRVGHVTQLAVAWACVTHATAAWVTQPQVTAINHLGLHDPGGRHLIRATPYHT